MKTYVLMGDPTPLMRARLSGKRVYDPQKNLKMKATIDLASQHDNASLLEGPLHLDVTFFMPVAKSMSEKRKQMLYGQYHTFKSDLDNCIKYIGDICNGLIYYDDCSIAKITAKKIYDAHSRTEFTITCLNN